MNANDAAASAGAKLLGDWRVLSEFTLASEPEDEQSEGRVLAKVAEALQRVHNSEVAAQELPGQLREALGASLARIRRRSASSPLLIRVLIPAEGLGEGPAGTERTAPAGLPAARHAPAAGARREQPHACGFFVVDRMAGSNGGTHQAADIFLYAEGRGRRYGAAPQANA